MDSVLLALPGKIQLTKTPLDTPSTTAAQRTQHRLGQDGLQVDRSVEGATTLGKPQLLVEYKTCNPRCHTFVLPKDQPHLSSSVSNAAAARRRAAAGRDHYTPHLHAHQTLIVFAMEVYGGCTQKEPDGSGFVETLRRFARDIAEHLHPGDAEDGTIAKKRKKAIRETMHSWRMHIAVRLAIARAQWIDHCVLQTIRSRLGAQAHWQLSETAAARVSYPSVRAEMMAVKRSNGRSVEI